MNRMVEFTAKRASVRSGGQPERTDLAVDPEGDGAAPGGAATEEIAVGLSSPQPGQALTDNAIGQPSDDHLLGASIRGADIDRGPPKPMVGTSKGRCAPPPFRYGPRPRGTTPSPAEGG